MQIIRFGDRLADALSARKLTQDQLARRLGVSQASVSRWLTHKGIPRSNALRELAKELTVSPQWLLTGEQPFEEERIYPYRELRGSSSNASGEPSSQEPDAMRGDRDSAIPTERATFHETQESLRLVIGDLTDLQIVARLHEMLEDKRYSMPHRLTLVQALLDELQARHQTTRH